MSMSADEFDKVFGLGWHTNAAEIKKRLTFVEHDGVPTNVVVPDFIGQECFDTVGAHWYKACGLLAADWKKLTP